MIKLPNFSGGSKVKIPVVNRSISRNILILLIIAAGGGVYLYSKKKVSKDDIRKVAVAPKVTGVVSPNSVLPNSFVTLTGTFTDEASRPVSTAEARYYMWERNTLEGMKLVSSGLIGNSVSSYRKNVPTTGLNPGQFLMLITDEPLSQADMLPLNAGPAPYGTGGSTTPIGGSAVFPNTQGVSLS